MISYIVPTRNSASTLNRTLLSLHSQEEVDIRVIVVDSDSTDGTLDICRRWDAEVLYAKPGNMYEAINVGLRACNTEWLGYINSDDYLYSNSVARLLSCGESTGAEVVYGNCDYVDINEVFMFSYSPAKPHQLLSISHTGLTGFAQQSSIFRRSLYEKLEGFREQFKFVADADFFMRAMTHQAVFSYIDGSPIACFRLHDKQLSQSSSMKMEHEIARVLEELSAKKNIRNRLVVLHWRMSNIPFYMLRIIRQSLLSGQLTFLKSMSSGKHISSYSAGSMTEK